MGAPVTLITGAASGIGRHLAGLLLLRGHRVLACDIDEEGLERACEEDGWPHGPVIWRKLDVRDSAAWEGAVASAVDHWHRLDIALNVAGYLKPGNIQDVEDADIARHLDVNTRGVILGTRAAARQMIKQGAGHIINIGSLASLAPVPGISLYVASKFAVRGFTLAAASELRPHGVSVSLVLPDAVATPMLDLQVAYDEAALTFSGSSALTVEEVGRVIVERVLPKKPLEITIPTTRGGLAKAAGLFPELGRALEPVLRRKGLKNQARRRS